MVNSDTMSSFENFFSSMDISSSRPHQTPPVRIVWWNDPTKQLVRHFGQCFMAPTSQWHIGRRPSTTTSTYTMSHHTPKNACHMKLYMVHPPTCPSCRPLALASMSKKMGVDDTMGTCTHGLALSLDILRCSSRLSTWIWRQGG